ncbi:hypothetical protein Tco_1548569 [Tanacetum coccineum]
MELFSLPADLIPSPKRVKDSGYLADVEVDPREISLRDDAIVRRARIGQVERVTHPAMLEDIPEPAQEGAVEVTCSERENRRLKAPKMPNTRSGASMTHEEVEELVTRRVAEEMEAREAARTLEPLNENGDEQEGGNGGNGGNGNGGNGNGGNGENRNRGNGHRNGNHGMN